jgi:AcrR family transcriptional regulator
LIKLLTKNERSFGFGEKMSDKRLWIMAATLQIIDEKGLQSTPMAAIAKRANVAMGTIYHHFPSKEDLVSEIYQELLKRLGNYVLNNYDAKAPVRTRLAQIVTSLVRYNLRHPQEFMFRDQYAYSPYIKPTAKVDKSGWVKAMSQIFIDGQAQEIVKPLNVDVLTQTVLAITNGLAKRHIAGEIVLDAKRMETTVDLCWDAIKR